MSGARKEQLRELTEEEREVLVQIARSQSEPAVHVARAKSLLAVAAGKSYSAAAQAAGRKSNDAVAQLVRRYSGACGRRRMACPTSVPIRSGRPCMMPASRGSRVVPGATLVRSSGSAQAASSP